MKKKRKYQIVVDYKGLKIPFIVENGKFVYAGNLQTLQAWGLDYIMNLNKEELIEFSKVVQFLVDPNLTIEYWLMKMLGFKIKDNKKKSL